MLLAGTVAGCPTQGNLLAVEVITGLVPGPEFSTVYVSMAEGTPTRGAGAEFGRDHYRRSVFADAASFRSGLRVAEYQGVRDGAYTVRVQLLRDSGTILIERWIALTVRGNSVVRVPLTSDCVDVACPAPSGSPAFSECMNGQCVDPFCNPDDPTTWEEHCCDPLDRAADCNVGNAFCGVVDDCGGRASCTEVECTGGLCIESPRESACAEREYCSPVAGCSELTSAPADAGMLGDGAIADAGTGDAGSGCVDVDRDRWCMDEDCDDADPHTFPGAAELCDEADNDCDTTTDEGVVELAWYRDADDDGYGSPTGGSLLSCSATPGYVQRIGDCNDADPTAYPGAPETCDRIDSDCDPATEARLEDADMDGHAPIGVACTGGFPADDCRGTDPFVYPGAPERCDLADQDCDTRIDEAAVDATTTYTDRDRDGYGDPATAMTSCFGASTPGGDCDDMDPSRNPGIAETCDGRDEDCSGMVDDVPAVLSPPLGETRGICATARQTCVTGSWRDDPTLVPGYQAPESTCDHLDNDCDGRTDEGLGTVGYVDADGDGYGATNPFDPDEIVQRFCPGDVGFVIVGGDRDDTSPLLNPGATEVCDGLDNDSDGNADTAPGLCTGGRVCADGSCRTCSTVGPTFSGAITDNQVWCASLGTVRITGNVVITPGASLTIEGGVTLRFVAGTGLTARGHLETIGTSTAPVLFTADATSPVPGSWAGITLDAGTRVDLRGGIIEYATNGINGGGPAALVTEGTIRSCTNGFNGLDGRTSDVTVTQCACAINYGRAMHLRLHAIDDDTVVCNFGGMSYAFIESELRNNDLVLASYVHGWFVRSLIVGNAQLGPAYTNSLRLVDSTLADNGGPFAVVDLDAHGSNICRNGATDFRLLGTTNGDATSNYWCTTSAAAIAARVYDLYDDPLLGELDYTPFLTAASPTAPPVP